MEFRITPDKKSALWISILGVISAFGIAAIIGVLLIPSVGLGISKWIALIIGEAMIILPAILFVRSRNYDFRKSFRLSKPPKGTITLTILMSFSLMPLVDELDNLFTQFFPLPPFVEKYLGNALEALKIDTVGSFILMTLGAVIIAGISEEILFRGFFQKSLENELSPIKAVVFSSILFSIVHFSPQLLQIFLLGTLLGYMALRADSLYPSILLHIINNAAAVIMINFETLNLFYDNMGNHVSPLIIVPALIIFGVALRSFHIKTASGAIVTPGEVDLVS